MADNSADLTWTETPDEAVESGRDTGAFGGAALNAASAPPSLSLAAMLAHDLGLGACAEAACSGRCAGTSFLGASAGCLGAALGAERGSCACWGGVCSELVVPEGAPS